MKKSPKTNLYQTQNKRNMKTEDILAFIIMVLTDMFDFI